MVKGKPSEPNVAASLHVDARNYARFLIAVLQGKGLSEAASKEMLRPQVKIPDEPGHSWGLGIAIEETPHGTNYGHGGRNPGFTSLSVMYKDRGIGYVFLVNNDDASKIDNVLNAYLIAGKSGLKNTKPIAHKAAKVDPKSYDAYVGRYEIGPRNRRDVHPRGRSSHGPARRRGQVRSLPRVGDRVLPQPGQGRHGHLRQG